MHLRAPLTNRVLPAARAAQGAEGITEGVDYRGVPVVAALRTVSASPWHLVARIDRAELLAPLHAWLWQLGALLVGLLLSAGCGMGLTYVVMRRAAGVIRRQQKSLHDIAERLTLLARQSRTVIWEVDDQGLYTYISPETGSLWGYHPDELVGRLHFYDLHPAAGRAAFKQAAFEVFAQRGSFTDLINAVRAKDGHTVWVSTTGGPVLSAAGSLQGYRGSDRDITARKAVEDSLQRSESRLRAITDSAQEAILMMDPAGRISYWNPAAEQIFGYTSAEALGQKLHALIIPSRYHAAHQAAFPAFQQTGHGAAMGKTRDLEARRKDGREISVQLSLSAVEIEGRWHAVGLIRDITERKQAEQALGQLLRKQELILSSLADGVHGLDLQGRVTFENGAATKLFGQCVDEMVGQPAHALVHHSHADGSAYPVEQCPIHATLRDGVIRRVSDEVFWRKDGTSFPVEYVTAPARDEHGVITGAVVVFRDITERKQVEAELAQLEARTWQLQKAESLGRMAGAIAHHFNNQLMAVMGNLELALQALPRDTEPSAMLGDALYAAQRAAEVSRLMLTYLGRATDALSPLDVSELCRQSLPLIQGLHPVTISTDLAAPGPVISANANQLRQVLTNLIINAAESGEASRGAIRLFVKTVSAREIPAAQRFPLDWQPQAQAYVCLGVADAGCGIAKEHVAKIFDPFFTTKFTGRGMGLAATLGLVRAHSGCITVASEPGQGSTFQLFFPALNPSALLPPPPQPAPGVAAGGTVLLVDDEEPLRKTTKAMLVRLGFTVLTATDGNAAVAVFRQHQAEIRCVLTDLTMPGLDGWATLAALRALRADLPVILSSGYAEANMLADAGAERPQAFLAKPYTLEALQKALDQALSGGGLAVPPEPAVCRPTEQAGPPTEGKAM